MLQGELLDARWDDAAVAVVPVVRPPERRVVVRRATRRATFVVAVGFVVGYGVVNAGHAPAPARQHAATAAVSVPALRLLVTEVTVTTLANGATRLTFRLTNGGRERVAVRDVVVPRVRRRAVGVELRATADVRVAVPAVLRPDDSVTVAVTSRSRRASLTSATADDVAVVFAGRRVTATAGCVRGRDDYCGSRVLAPEDVAGSTVDVVAGGQP